MTNDFYILISQISQHEPDIMIRTGFDIAQSGRKRIKDQLVTLPVID
jgi:hypothetical protein